MFDSHDTSPEWRKKTKGSGRYSSTVLVPGNFLSEGTVIIGVGLVTPDPFVVHLHERDLIAFRVVDYLREGAARGDYMGSFPGVVRPVLPWRMTYQPIRRE